MACAACGGAPLEPYLEVRRSAGDPLVPTSDRYGAAPADLVRCPRCGHAQVAELPPEAELDQAYGGAVDEEQIGEEAGERATAAAALERIERHVPCGSLCDLGCWLGFLPAEAERRGWRARAVEPSRFAARFARERLGVDVQTATIAEADLPEGAFDAVVLADVIEHLPRPDAALERAGRLLRPGGVVYLALPDAGSRVARTLGARWWSILPTHVQYFSRSSMGVLLSRSGFTVEWMGTAPKSFSVAYYLGRARGYSPAAARVTGAIARWIGVADRVVAPDLRDRMAIVARRG